MSRVGLGVRVLSALLCVLYFSGLPLHSARASDDVVRLPLGSDIGLGFGLQIKEWRAIPEDLDDIHDLGVTYLRFGYGWDVIERPKGSFDWGASDHFMKQLSDRGLRSVFELGGTHGGYSPKVDTVPNTPTGIGGQETAAPMTNEARQALLAFMAETVRRYHGDNVTWEIWNEPDMNSNWPPEVNADQFAVLISQSCQVIKTVDPTAKVIGPALAFLPATNDNGHGNFLATILRSPAGGCLDAVSVHPYRHKDEPPETVFADYEKLRAYIKANTLAGRKQLPIVSSEWGFSLSEVTEEQQAAYILRAFLANRLADVPISVSYEYEDSFEDHETIRQRQEREAHFGIRDYNDDEKLSNKVLKDILPHLRGSAFDGRLFLGDDKVFALQLREAGGRAGILFWLADRTLSENTHLDVKVGAQTTSYHVGLIPTFVCTGQTANVTLVSDPLTSGAPPLERTKEFYVACPE